MTLAKLIEAVEAGEYHNRPTRLPRFTELMDAVEKMQLKFSRDRIVKAMSRGRNETAAYLRALQAEAGE